MCEFHDSNCNGFGDIWWTDKCTYFSSIDDYRDLFIRPVRSIEKKMRPAIEGDSIYP